MRKEVLDELMQERENVKCKSAPKNDVSPIAEQSREEGSSFQITNPKGLDKTNTDKKSKQNSENLHTP